MKSLAVASFGMLFFVGAAMAQTAGPSAAGTYRFVLEDGVTRYLDFSAIKDERGVTTGQMRYLDPNPIPEIGDAEDPLPGEVPPEFSIMVTFDSLTVDRNRAVLNGTIRESSHRTYVGRWVQLVVEDNGTDSRIPDQLTWSFCGPRSGRWVPSDAEVPGDGGAYLSWWATDAERRDDVGIPSPSLLPVEERSCPLYLLEVYSFADIRERSGDIAVQP